MTAGPATAALFRRLRLRLTAAFVIVALVGSAVLCVILLELSSAFEQRNLFSELRGLASRATALTYVEDGVPKTDGLSDDALTTWAHGLAVFDSKPPPGMHVLFSSGRINPGDVEAIARESLRDSAENGTVADVSMNGEELTAVAMPWFDGDSVRGSAVVVAPRPQLLTSRLLVPFVAGGLALVGILTAMVWLIAGRGLRMADRAFSDRERFLATAAHELRTPLARLRAGAESLRRIVPAQPHGAALQQLLTSADTAGRVVANILLASRIDRGDASVRRMPVRLDEVAGGAEHLHKDLVVDIREPVTVSGDPDLIRHAVANLVDNALRHGGVGADSPQVTVSVFTRDGAGVLQVSDHGPGLPPEADVVARYAAGPQGGTGLGLSLVRWIADQHDATLRLGDHDGSSGGAVVELTFPQLSDPRKGRSEPTGSA